MTSVNVIFPRWQIVLFLWILFHLFSCKKEIKVESYQIEGMVVDTYGNGLEGIRIESNQGQFTTSNAEGKWVMSHLNGLNIISAHSKEYSLSNPITVVNGAQTLEFLGSKIWDYFDLKVYQWFCQQQLPNGLLESVENGNVISLYDNALAAMVFMLKGDYERAEKIFNYFNARINSELDKGVGGFSQLRDKNGVPNNHRWMGDNAWLIIATKYYKRQTNKNTYDNLTLKLFKWLENLQDTDGGLFAGYDANNLKLNYKVTEGNLDVLTNYEGDSPIQKKILEFLKKSRWNVTEKSFVSWPENPKYLYALDLHAWGYAMLHNFPDVTLTQANRFINTQTASNGKLVSGYCFDEDKDNIWVEGTGQMALSFALANRKTEKNWCLSEIEKLFMLSSLDSNAGGFPYASNLGTAYGADPLWQGADTKIAISSGAWYLFAKHTFNPFILGKTKRYSTDEQFW